MAKQANTLFLEDWLRSNGGGGSSGGIKSAGNAPPPSSSSARAIIQAWAELRDCLQHQSFQPHHLQSLKTLLHSQASLHVADPQAKLLISILSSPDVSLPQESHPMFLRLLYFWVRKSFRPNPVLVDSAVEVVCGIVVSARFDSDWGHLVFSEGVLVLGAFSVVPAASNASKVLCLESICRLLEHGGALMRLYEGVIANVLAGIGYALSCPVNVHYNKFVSFLLGVWGSEDGPQSSIPNGLMILHLIEWLISGYINSSSLEKIRLFSQIALENSEKHVPYALSMAAGGVLRAFNRLASRGAGEILGLRISAEDKMEYLASGLISRMGDPGNFIEHPTDRLLLQCLALSFARSGLLSSRAPFLICLASALMSEIFPLRRFYAKILDNSLGTSAKIRHDEVREHVESVLFKEGGAVTGIFCNLYASANEQNKALVENLFWRYCYDLYLGHRQVVLVLQGRDNNLLGDLEKIAESAFLMVVMYALAVTKQKLTPKHSKETQMEVSVQILIAFSCLEYFRHMRLAEYLDTVRAVLPSVQENESACVTFVESIPSYADLTVGQGSEYCWSTDDVQTARVLFYLRVIPTCIERLLSAVFRKSVAPTMFLYMGHPNVKVARAAHSLFAAFVSSGQDSFEDQRASLKEQLVFYYMQRSLEAFPAITPFEGLASGVAAIVRHLPAGSPAIFYCIHSIAEKANKLCSVEFVQDGHLSMKWQGDSEPCKDVLELLLRLLSLVDVQVLPDLMKLLAQLMVQLPKDGQNMVLNDLYAQVADSDDLTRKPTLVSWLQSLSYLCTQAKSSGSDISKISSSKKESPSWSAKVSRL
ncbi:hypothetical protein BT93_E0355 [Corymbia citriodora subsp. variegata]|nr:hypothetical protein BT93_E0355 [Corymbia citriodora subsp. variegata]